MLCVELLLFLTGVASAGTPRGARHTTSGIAPPSLSPVMRVWSTPFVSAQLDSNEVLVDLVRALRRVDPGVQRSNKDAKTAWHSQEMLEPGFLEEMLSQPAAETPPSQAAAYIQEIAGNAIYIYITSFPELQSLPAIRMLIVRIYDDDRRCTLPPGGCRTSEAY